MNSYYRFFWLIAAGWLSMVQGQAQTQEPATDTDIMKQEVEVVQEYNPTVSDAFKINEMPKQEETPVETPVFTYELAGKAIMGAPEVVPLIAAKIAKPPMEELFPSYVRGYFGNYTLLGGMLNYNLVQNTKYALALNLAHESSLGKLKLLNGEKVDAPYHQTDGGLAFRHFFKDKTLRVNMDFDNLAYEYYGYSDLLSDENYATAMGDTLTGAELTPNARQHQTNFGFSLGLQNLVSKHRSTEYDLNLGYQTFGNEWGIKENKVMLNGDFEFPVGDFALSLAAGADHASTNFKADDIPTGFMATAREQTLVYFNPSVVRRGDQLDFKMGLRFGAGFDDLEDDFYLSPDLQLSLTVVEEVIALEGGITGEIKPSYYSAVMAENPFVSPDVNVKTAFHGVKFYLGTKGNFSRATSFAARLDYSAFTNEHFFVNRTYASADSTVASNLFDVSYDDGNMLKVSGELRFNFEPDFNLLLQAAYYSWQLDSLDEAWYKPAMTLGVRGNYQINEELQVYASFNVLGQRKASVNNSVQTLDAVPDINLGADYRYNKRWHFFTEFRNVISADYDRWYGYPSQGINVRAGAGYSF